MVVMLGVAVGLAFQFGEKSPVYAAGSVRLNDDLAEAAVGMRTLYITVFDATSPSPMPYGAMRETLNEDPNGEFFHFMLTPERLQVMNPSKRLPRYIRIKARLDRDGQGGMDQSGDLTGEIDTVKVGNRDVAVVIDKKIL